MHLEKYEENFCEENKMILFEDALYFSRHSFYDKLA